MEQGNIEDYVYDKLKNAIFKRTLRPDTRLVETKIAGQLGVSRTPVRAAIKRLTHDGYVKYIQNRGASIVKPTRQEIYDTFEVRMEIEKIAVRKAINRVTNAAILKLEDLIAKEMETFNRRDIGVYYNLNYDLHLGIASLSGNPVLEDYLSKIIYRSQIFLILYENFYQLENNPSYPEHRQIIKTLKLGNLTLAEAAVEEHIHSTLKGLKLEEDYRKPEDRQLVL